MSGESSSASPGCSAVVGTSLNVPSAAPEAPVVRASLGKIRWSSNQRTSSGWQASTGARVVGRRTPAGLTSVPTRLFRIVDLPAPVEPPTTIKSGRVHLPEPRQEIVVDLGDGVVARPPSLARAVQLEREDVRLSGRP